MKDSLHAATPDSGLSALRAVTLNHRNVGVGAMRQFAAGRDASMAVHQALSAEGVESFVLATCNRTELYWRAPTPDDGDAVGRRLGQTRGDLADSTRLSGRAAAVHLFRVCAGLESLVLGEAEILGQVRTALEACTGAGPFLEGVVRAALRTGRMARAETAIGVGAQSVASAAVRVLADSLTLADSRVLVVGAGDTGRKAARHLRARGVGRLLIANRTPGPAEALAAEVDGTVLSLDRLAGELTQADAIVCAVSASTPLVDADGLTRTTAERRGRRLIVVDLSMPPAVARVDLPGIERVDLDALACRVAGQRDRRTAEIPRVEAVIDREIPHLEAWARQRVLRPLASNLRRKVEATQRTELAYVDLRRLFAFGPETQS